MPCVLAHVDCWAIDEYGQITLMNKGFDLRFFQPQMLPLYSKRGVNP